MLKENQRVVYMAAVGVDAALVSAAYAIAYYLRDQIESSFLQDLAPFHDYLPMLFLVVPIWLACLRGAGVYASMREKRYLTMLFGVVEASIVGIFLFSAAAFLLKWELLSRVFVVVFFLTVTILLTTEKWFALWVLHSMRARGFNFRVLLIVGSGPRAQAFGRSVEKHPEWGLRISGYIDEPEFIGMRINSGRVVGSFDDLPAILDNNVIDEVVFLMPRRWLSRLEDSIRACEKVGVRATVAVDFFDTAIARPVLADLNGWPLLTFDSTPNDYVALFCKRGLDFVGSLAGLMLLAPIFAALALAIRLDSPGPIFFRQVRCGVHGRKFEILKFRTMGMDAENQLAALKARNEVGGPVFKIKNDPRITRVGRLLRRTSLDELPQLWNVLCGDMSLVGPRPPLPKEVEQYER
ncbi:MAG TPA: sugar transferase, partial [Nitrospirota bacterium]|nr:sugar transferase [Nitrospirota bacterium]